MIRGLALAGGCGLAMLTTFSIAAESAKFGLPEINIGMWPMMVMPILFRTVGRRKGLELICTGDLIEAREAENIGLITKVVPDAELEGCVLELANKIKERSGSSYRLGIDTYQKLMEMEYEQAVSYARDMAVILTNTADCREGTNAFVEKRKPRWST
jgi:enoyl-CoA hydratase/carnithine racemase